jgi:periplasmic copper chaperone A
MILVNSGKTALRLTGGSTSISAMVHAMISTNGKGMEGMQVVSGLDIPPGGKLVLQPGGNHLMLMGLTKHPKPGEVVDLKITLDPGAKEVQLKVPVLRQPTK